MEHQWNINRTTGAQIKHRWNINETYMEHEFMYTKFHHENEICLLNSTMNTKFHHHVKNKSFSPRRINPKKIDSKRTNFNSKIRN